jgi:hypothetical protein
MTDGKCRLGGFCLLLKREALTKIGIELEPWTRYAPASPLPFKASGTAVQVKIIQPDVSA